MKRTLGMIVTGLALLACSAHEDIGSSSSALAGDVTVEKVGMGTVASISSDGILCSTGCLSVTYNFTTPTVTLRGEAAVGWVFDHWEGDCTSTGEICTLSPTAGSFARAIFVPLTNPVCPSSWLTKDFFTKFPIATTSITRARTFSVSPPDHTFPNWHMFIDANAVVPVVAPTNVKVTSVMREGENYYFRLSPCRDVELLVALVQNVSLSIKQRLGASDATVGNTEFWSHPSLALTAGQALGTVQRGTNMIALELYDDRQPVAAWTHPTNYRAVHWHIQCPVDYFTSSIRSDVMGKFSDGQCHRPDQDLAPYLQGNWFADSEPRGVSQAKDLAFVNDLVQPGGGPQTWSPVVSIGTAFGADLAAGRYPITTGAPFDVALPQPTVYCWPVGTKSLVVSFDDIDHLRAKVVPTACAAIGLATIETVAPGIPTVAFHR